ncbi:class I SAM-dependent methyltransferase [Parachlamydia sp. AcF125]|uniref:class I SAM-dependent methyltransferase n=1 Tax=Parachlamydia sp. AcF125 TaxID=2795736 RepID=UPI001BC97E82|nr:class I SAM-dependent methyltransferase [Parachlamydia sp. AcF125]MBS4167700.1 hypothetical protein [Parachlamydia sp. AcF125]
MDILFYSFFFILSTWILISIVAWSYKTGISPMPTAPAVSKTIFSNMAFLHLMEGAIYELGAGWGTLAFPLARKYPAYNVIGCEVSFFPHLYCLVRHHFSHVRNLQFLRQNFFSLKLENAALVVCYLYPAAMQKLKIKLEKELKPGCHVISNTFAIPGWTPYDVWTTNDLYQTKIYVYRIPASISSKK